MPLRARIPKSASPKINRAVQPSPDSEIASRTPFTIRPIEIQAGMTSKEIEKTIDLLVRKTRELEDEKPKIILPPGVDRSIPPRPPVKPQ